MSKEINFKIIPQFERYYKDETSWGVYSFITEDDIPEYKCVTQQDFYGGEKQIKQALLVGKVQQLVIGSEYKVTATLEYNETYKSHQYVPKIVTAIVPTTEEKSYQFLKCLGYETKGKELLKHYPNIIDQVINDEDNVDVSILHGIKDFTWNKIRSQIVDNFIMSEIITILQPLGITYKAIKRLLTEIESPALLKKELKENPYVLTKIKNFGFKRADALALKINPELRVSAKRLLAYLNYYFYEIGENEGHTWVRINNLDNSIRNNVNECFGLYEQLINDEKINSKYLYIKDGKVSLKYYHDIEVNILDMLCNINKIDYDWDINIDRGIREAENEQGFELTQEQLDVIYKACDQNIVVVCGKAGCVDCDTEYFNGIEWRKISDYSDNDKVLQYNIDGTANLVEPLSYIKESCDMFNLIQNNSKSVNQCVCNNHNLVFKTSRGNIIKKPFLEFKEMHNQNLGYSGKIITTFSYNGTGINLTDAQIRVMVAMIADGSIAKQQCIFNFKKERKKERLKQLLKNAKIPYKEKESTIDGYNKYYIYPPRLEKIFTPEYWYNCSQHQLQIIADELVYWDGSNKNNRQSISSNNKINTDFIQFVYSATGNRARITYQDRTGETRGKYIRHSIDYDVHISKHKNISLKARRVSNINEIKNYKSIDGFKYCFEVPSGMLVLRRNGTINITGNSGKTTITRALLKIYKDYKIQSCALSAKAAQRITEATGFPASTIHRTLGAKGANYFTYNKDNKLDADIILIDECSMINASLFHDLLSAVKQGSKVIMCGDNRQLPPIGFGNIFSDLLEKNEYFNINQLTKVHRQAEKSGILVDANKIREGIIPIPKPKKIIVTGELQDMFYMFRESHEELQNIAIKTFMKSVEEESLDDVVVIVPRKQDCINSTSEYNRLIQDELISDNVPFVESDNKKYKLGAKVIQRVNDYSKNVFNGEIGYITDIIERIEDKKTVKYTTVEYELNDTKKTIIYSEKELAKIDLAYALTIHLSQGSGYNTVIIVIDTNHYSLLDTCLLYTAITRAKKRCLLLGVPKAFELCLNKNFSLSRQTWLKEFNEDIDKEECFD